MSKKERIEELEKLLTAECGKYEKDCTTCPYRKACIEYESSSRIFSNISFFRLYKCTWTVLDSTKARWKI